MDLDISRVRVSSKFTASGIQSVRTPDSGIRAQKHPASGPGLNVSISITTVNDLARTTNDLNRVTGRIRCPDTADRDVLLGININLTITGIDQGSVRHSDLSCPRFDFNFSARGPDLQCNIPGRHVTRGCKINVIIAFKLDLTVRTIDRIFNL